MDFLDIRTVLFSHLLVQCVCAAVMALLWRHNRGRYQGVHLWAAGYGMQALGTALILLRGHIPDLVSIPVANTIGIGAIVFIYAGLARFAGLRPYNPLNWGLLAVFAGVHYYASMVRPDFMVRNMNFNLAVVAYCGLCLKLLAGYPESLRRHARPAMHVFGAFVALGLARSWLTLADSPAHQFFDKAPRDTFLLLLYGTLLILLTFCLFLMVNRRLMDDTREDYEGRCEAETALGAALRVARLGTWSWDLERNRLDWSDEMCAIFGIRREDFSNDPAAMVSRFIFPEDRGAVAASNARMLAEGRFAGTEYRIKWPDGSAHWIYAEAFELRRGEAGRPALLKGYAQDITQRKLAQEQLRESAAILEFAMSSAGMGAWHWDIKADKRVFDTRTCSLLGLSASFKGTAEEFFRIVHPDDRVALKNALALTIENDAHYRPEYRAVWADGSVHHIAARGRLRRDEAGRPWRIDGVVWDVTDRKQAEAAIQAAQKLESLGTLAGGIAHDFNNLLTGITGNLSLMRRASAGGADLEELLKEAEAACFSARGLARQLLTFASGGDPVKTAVDLPELVKDAVSFSLRGSAVRADLGVPGGRICVHGDKDQLFQVFQNIALNGAQAMPGGGELAVSVAELEMPPGNLHRLPRGRYAAVTLKDGGAGMPESVLARIFDPYFSTKGNGRGLGLAVCRSVVLKHGGQITAHSEQGRGSSFTVYLPVSRQAAGQACAPAAPARAGKGRVLIMDDEEVVYKALKRMLTALGYGVEIVLNGEEALKAWGAARDGGRPFDLAIMDLTIAGGMGGAEAVKRLKQMDPEARVVASSGYAEDPVMADHAAHGFDGVLSKPYSVDDLAGVLGRVLGRGAAADKVGS